MKITVSGIYVHPRHHWLAASCDGELSVGPAPGIVELKVHASAALAWLVDNSAFIPDPPFGLHHQPQGTPNWEILSMSSYSAERNDFHLTMGAGASAGGTADDSEIFAQIMVKWDTMVKEPQFALDLKKPGSLSIQL